ncbi:MAG: helix-turn-helix domain-containing protein, partial [bacterium]|nr:helix-turn-helix domain-containing protein [bacterium]
MSNTIIRAPRRHRFVVMDQRTVEDDRLSWAARGLLCYLLSRPDDWKVLVNDLRKRGNLGRDGIYRLLRELRTLGYARFQRLRDRNGRIRGGIYFIREIADSPDPGLPDT